MLPPVKKELKLEFNHFPTKVHAVIFRCWESVSKEKIAEVLHTTAEEIENIAKNMGLPPQKSTEMWKEKGYLTIIKALWHILPYSQITQILDWDEATLDFILKEDDFFGIKLGQFKPYCEPVYFREFTEKEKNEEKEIKEILEKYFSSSYNDSYEPFDFFRQHYPPFPIKKDAVSGIEINSSWCINDTTKSDIVKIYTDDFKADIKAIFGFSFSENEAKKINITFIEESDEDEEYHEIEIKKDCINISAPKPFGIFRGLRFLIELTKNSRTFVLKEKSYKQKPVFKTRYIYSFCGLYTNALDVDTKISFPDSLLKEYSKCKINGIWIQGILYKLTRFPFDPSLSEGYEKRIKNLKELAKRAERYGIRVYMYLNEPRAMHKSFFGKFPKLCGHKHSNDNVSMCTSTNEVKKYLSEALSDIVKKVPELGGFFTITASENQTNCWSLGKTNCPVCNKRTPEEVISEVNTVMAEAAFKENKDIKFFVWDWGWKSYYGLDSEKIIQKLPQKAIMLSVSEEKMKFEKGGIKGDIIDYSLSMAGPSDETKKYWRIARKHHHETAAKVQLNTSWECSTAPFLPVYDTVLSHMNNIKSCNVSHLMMSWTLGGYPSDNIKIASGFFFENADTDINTVYDKTLESIYGDYKETIKKAVSHFSKAFSEFPFNVQTLYCGPQNSGVSNLLFDKPTNFPATMTCFPYDDLEAWRSIYPKEILINQFKKICEEWEKGLEVIKTVPDCDFKDMAEYGYSLFKSSLNQAKYVTIRNTDSKKELKILEDELALAVKTYFILRRNSSIGFEAANHYYVSPTMLMEKVLNCKKIIKKLSD